MDGRVGWSVPKLGSPEFRCTGNSPEVWRHRLRSWARQSSGALGDRLSKSGKQGNHEGLTGLYLREQASTFLAELGRNQAKFPNHYQLI